jgi:cytochrome c-type biogenesis protein CcmH
MKAALALAIFVLAQAGWAQQPDALDERVKALSAQLRCLVCQNQTIAESNAPLAADLRRLVREQLAAGRSEREVIDFMVARYGDFVLYRPPLNATTLLLWFGPALLLAAGALTLVLVLRRRRARGEERALSDEEHRRAQELLERDVK